MKISSIAIFVNTLLLIINIFVMINRHNIYFLIPIFLSIIGIFFGIIAKIEERKNRISRINKKLIKKEKE
jgi:hypothetical protein